jgi:hypothetical protein
MLMFKCVTDKIKTRLIWVPFLLCLLSVGCASTSNGPAVAMMQDSDDYETVFEKQRIETTSAVLENLERDIGNMSLGVMFKFPF